MYVVCDNFLPLSEGWCYRCSYIEALLNFARRFPEVQSCSIYKDLGCSHKCKDYQYIATYNKKQMKELRDHYDNDLVRL